MIETTTVRILNELSAGAPQRVLLVPWGDITNLNGERFIVNEESARRIAEQLAANTVRKAFDYAHDIEGNNEKLPGYEQIAAGWIAPQIESVPGEGIYVHSEWTPRAAELIKNKEFRYVSPVVVYRKSDKVVIGIDSAALTNKPAIPNMPVIKNSQLDQIGDSVWESLRYTFGLPPVATYREIIMQMEEFLKKVRADLGLPDTADAPAVLTAISANSANHKALRAAVVKAGGLAADAAGDAVVACANALKPASAAAEPDMTQFVPMTKHAEVVTRLNSVEGQMAQANAAKFVEGGMHEGRICNANAEAWTKRHIANAADAEEALKLVPANSFPAAGRVVNAAMKSVSGDPIAKWNAAITEKMSVSKLSRPAAISAVNKENPGLREDYVSAVNAQTRRAG